MMAEHYSYIDLDLLLTGAILHDIGKVAELTYDRTFGYSSEGQLVGHIAIGLRFLHEKLHRLPEFPAKLRILVEHMILSHHGELEFGSPKVPLFPEALLLHHLDNLDSKMECMRALAEEDRLVDGHWTSYNSSLGRAVLKKDKYLCEEKTAAAQEVAGEVTAPSPPSTPPVNTPREGRPRTASFFAEKLQQAWRKGS